MAREAHIRKRRVGIIQQSKTTNHWNAPLDATGAYNVMPYSPGDVDQEPEVFNNQLEFYAAQGIMDSEARRYIESTSGLHRMTFSNSTSTMANVSFGILSAHLVAALQPEGTITEAATTPFAKNAFPPDRVLDWANNEGYIFTVATGNYDDGASVGDGQILENAALDVFSMDFENTENGTGRLKNISGEWVGNRMTYDNYFSGTWVDLPATPTFYEVGSFNVTITLNSGSYATIDCWRRFNFTFTNNFRSDCRTTGGKANNYKWAPELTFTLDIPYVEGTNGTWKILKDYADGSNVSLNIFNGDGSNSGDLNIFPTRATLTEKPFVANENDYHAIRLVGKCERPTSGWTSSFLRWADGLDGNWD